MEQTLRKFKDSVMNNSIPISPRYGLNPTIPLCIYCGKEKDELALLGKLPNDEKAPKTAIIDYEPCKNCKYKIDTEGYIGFIADCGHSGLIKQTILSDKALKNIGSAKVFRMQKCFKCLGVTDD